MTVQTLRDLLRQRPFQPFRLVMAGGQRYIVSHPEMAMLTRTSILACTDLADDIPTEFRICFLRNITAIEML